MVPVPERRSWSAASFLLLVTLCLWLSLSKTSLALNVSLPTVETVYVIPSALWGLGFLRPPKQEMDAIKPHLDAVIQACGADPQFRWTIESGWQLQAWLERTKDSAQIMTRVSERSSDRIYPYKQDKNRHT